jgi:hypothetical protein
MTLDTMKSVGTDVEFFRIRLARGSLLSRLSAGKRVESAGASILVRAMALSTLTLTLQTAASYTLLVR